MRGRKIKRGFLSFLFAMAMMLALAGWELSVHAEGGANDTVTLAGSGTEEDPYLIGSEADLQQVNLLSDGTTQYYYKLTADIDLAKAVSCGDFYGGKYYIENFSGTLDGAGHTIYGSTDATYFIYMFCTGEIKSLTWECQGRNTLVCDTDYGDRTGPVRKFTDITVTGSADYGSSNNTSPVLIYASYNITMQNVVVKADITGEAYHGIFVGYSLYNYTDIEFIGCGFEGTAVGNYMGMFFGNSNNMEKYMGATYSSILSVTVQDCYNTGTIAGMSGDGARYLCAPISSFTEGSNLLAKEQEIMAANQGLTQDGLQVLAEVGGYTVNSDGNYQITVENANEAIDHFVLGLSYYSRWFVDGADIGTIRHTINDVIPAKEGVTTYYSTLKDLAVYDGDDGDIFTTGKEAGISMIEKDGQTYYYLKKDGTVALSSLDTNTVSSNLSFSIFAYNADNKIIGKIESRGSNEYTTPVVADYEAPIGQAISGIELADGYSWVDETQSVVAGGQTFYAYKDAVILPIFVTGYAVDAEQVTLDKTSVLLAIGDTAELTASVSPENTTDKTVTWSSSDPNVAAVDENGVITGAAAGKAVITAQAGSAAATCEVVVYAVEEPKAPAADLTQPVEEVTVSVSEEINTQVHQEMSALVTSIVAGDGELSDSISEETAEKVKAAAENGSIISTEIVAELLDETQTEQTDVKAIEEVLGENDVVAQYLNLEILLKVDGEVLGNVNQLSEAIPFTIKVPDELQKDGRTFYVVRVHNDIAEVLQSTINEDGTITFWTDKFSTYALAYTDEPEDEDTPPDDGNTPPDDGNTPPDDGNTPPDDGNTPPDDGNTPSDNGNTPPDDGNTTPDDNGTKPGDNGTKPDDNGTKPGNNGTKPGNNGTKPGANTDNKTDTTAAGKKAVKTGDNANIIWMFLLMGMSGCCVVGVRKRMK